MFFLHIHFFYLSNMKIIWQVVVNIPSLSVLTHNVMMKTINGFETMCFSVVFFLSYLLPLLTGQLTPTVNSPQKYVGQLTSVFKYALRSKQPIGGIDDCNNNSHSSKLTGGLDFVFGNNCEGNSRVTTYLRVDRCS